ncbi:MAG: sulfotransferase [Acidobacteria bacterium]|nr:sulfotransferase [Acidobacteriota bacterium]
MIYAYLASVEHSGSTLVACLLSAHPQIATVGEFGASFPGTERCSCGQRFEDDPFWADWAAEAGRRGLDFRVGAPDINLQPRRGAGILEDLFFYQFQWEILNRLRDRAFPARCALQKRAHTAVRRSVALARILCDRTGASVFVDTTKNPLQVRFLRRDPSIRVKLIALRRDGRAVMSSLIEKEKRTPDRAVGAWLWGNRNLERAAQCLLPADVYWLKHEDLCREPDRVLRELLAFLEVDPSVPLDYSDRASRHVVGNRRRHEFDGVVRADDAWGTKLRAEDLALFETHAGSLNRRYGYGA